MVTVKEALGLIANCLPAFKVQNIRLEKAHGLYLAEDVTADRDFPPYHRVAMDGIAINMAAYKKGLHQFPVEGMVRAGQKPQALVSSDACLEVMTGAMLPAGTSIVIPYEQVTITNGSATIAENYDASEMMNVHQKGSDVKEGSVILKRGTKISAPEIGALASVGKHAPLVFAPSRIAVISTGDELVEIDNAHPEDFQIRKSNPYAIKALIESFGPFPVDLFHINDQQDVMMREIKTILEKYEIVLLSGGVSAGKFDFVPTVLRDLKVEEIFHKIKQRPGKPLWFGRGPVGQLVFGLPGNPISALFSCRRYVITALGWLISGGQFKGVFEGQKVVAEATYQPANGATGRTVCQSTVGEASDVSPEGLSRSGKRREGLSFFRPCLIKQGMASFYTTNGSGDLLSLCGSDGFIELPPDHEIKAGEEIVLFSWRAKQ
ncbi:MAG: hypothetical protein A2X86_22350 [Bdellovibrionales bacterium GWA2_49_15]|nr:MAG: hypothetical protein A2X86_22350 [Bdellovibrionales bacterium GWA2_49_15]HAZ14779.1 molybdopterin molybdenumtransferase MoeA [Bdellovibrionales bacterium]